MDTKAGNTGVDENREGRRKKGGLTGGGRGAAWVLREQRGEDWAVKDVGLSFVGTFE